MNKILKILENNPALKALQKEKGDIFVSHTSDEALLIASSFLLLERPILLIAESQYQAQMLYQDLKGILEDKVSYFPVDESLRIEALASSYELMGERVNTLASLCQTENQIVVTHVHGAARYIPSKEIFEKHILHLDVGMTIEPQDLRKHLVESGYHHIQRVDEPFYYSKRGGVFDVYSIQYENPIRIEFFDDEIESIRFFDKDTQRSLEQVKSVDIVPATDLLFDENEVPEVTEKIVSLCTDTACGEFKESLEEEVALDIEMLKSYDYSSRLSQYMGLFASSTTLSSYFKKPHIIFSNKEKCESNMKIFIEETFYYVNELKEMGRMIKDLPLYHDIQSLFDQSKISFSDYTQNEKQIVFEARPIDLPLYNEKQFIQQIQDYTKTDRVLICLETQHQIQNIVDVLDTYSIHYTMVGNDENIYDGINIYLGNLKTGIDFYGEHIIVLTSHELFKSAASRKQSYIKYKDAKILKDYNELNIGDYVVHDVNGIGQYMGIKTLEVKGIKKDYLYIAYKGNDTLYIPVENFKLVRKYSSRDGKVPHIHSLNSKEWQKTKAKVRKKVDGLADQLIELYAERMKQVGFAYPKDDELQLEFEDQFGYELTPDQKTAVAEIKADMELPRPMDRLLCGDVGFGKTEVALRGCFKAVRAHKQVAFLCPTTILSAQHYHTITKRFENFPVNIALLNRFTSAKEEACILKDLKKGKIDILIGTHRILSKDIEFKDLGLLCIDEEQRFGVRQKEKIKEYRKSIDVLTLSATPIPRTLQMSLMGIRGLSQIETPPLNRMPVQTYVMEKNQQLIKQVIEREMARHGQVFYLHNRTENIEETANQIKALIPNAKVGIGHGKMTKEHLEDVMQEFTDKKYDVLVCTTIIETGIDIPNANTIVIEEADHFGLAQLYQIKGRVGRSERIAYAYLLYNRGKQLTPEASKRLKAIKEFAQLGSGYKIAMRDLSIRGSGDILGGEQAGFIDSVGFDMYMQILEEAINEKKGNMEKKKEVPTQNINVNGYIPENYLESDMDKLNLYQRIYKATKMDEIMQLETELKDLYGTLPQEVDNIVLKRKFEILCSEAFIQSVQEVGDQLQLTFTQDFTIHVEGDKLFELINRLFNRPEIKYSHSTLVLCVKTEGDWLPMMLEFLNEVKKTLISVA